jgi:type I restriction enzyme S subunit
MSMKSNEFADTGVPVLNVGCVQWGRFNELKLDHLPPALAARFDRYRVKPGDVLFTRSGTVGRCSVVLPHQDGWLMTFHLLRVRTDPSVCDPHYLRMVFEGASHIRRQTREASIGTTRAGFNTNLLAELDVPLPSLAEQQQIVAEVERRLSVAAATEAQLAADLRRAARLRQAILRRAFAGQLVPQDPADEPADKLLERIRRSGTFSVNEPKPRGRRRTSEAGG